MWGSCCLVIPQFMGGCLVNTIVIDGNNLAYRCNSVTELTTKDGRRTSAIYGVLNSIPNDIKNVEKLLGEPIHECVVVWDYGKNKRRLNLYPEYKGTRKHDATEEDKLWYEDFITQTNILHESLSLFGIKSLKVKGQECDDLIYSFISLARKHRDDEENHFVIISTDEDFFQLISSDVSVYSPIKQIYYTHNNFLELFGVLPEYFLGYKILKGDTSDNIIGIRGIGEKTGKSLVNTYGGLQGILDPRNRENLMKSKVTSKIFTPEGLQTLDRNNQLIGLEEFVDVDETKQEVEEILFETPDIHTKGILNFLREYQLSSLLSKYTEYIEVFKQLLENYCSE